MTPDKNFRMWKSTKTQIASMAGTKEDRNHYKKMMIDAQLCEEAARRAALRSKDTKDSKDQKGSWSARAHTAAATPE